MKFCFSLAAQGPLAEDDDGFSEREIYHASDDDVEILKPADHLQHEQQSNKNVPNVKDSYISCSRIERFTEVGRSMKQGCGLKGLPPPELARAGPSDVGLLTLKCFF